MYVCHEMKGACGSGETFTEYRKQLSTYVHLDSRVSLAVLGGNSGSLDDLDRFVAGSVATGHVVICSCAKKRRNN